MVRRQRTPLLRVLGLRGACDRQRVTATPSLYVTRAPPAACARRRVKVIYPWISKPDAEAPLSPEEQKRREKAEAKAGRVKYGKAR